LLLALYATTAGQAKTEPATELINKQLSARWKELKLQPADKTGDAEFLRRVSLDIIGRIPTLAELQAFEKDTTPDKRAKLVDKLLASEEYADYWADLWTDWLIGQAGTSVVREPFRGWLKGELAKSSYQDLATRLLTAKGKAADNPAVHFTLAHIGKEQPPARWEKDGQFDAVPLTRKTLRAFLGYRLNYDLPDTRGDGDWTKQDFWNANAFFRAVEVKNGAVGDNPAFNKEGVVYFEQENQAATPARPMLPGSKAAADAKAARRQALADLLTSHPNFARAHVNRVWGELFGRGLQERPVVDDFGSQNKVVHPELLDGLAKEFVQSGYDTKKLIRAICLSDAYQLKSTTNATNVKPELEVYFSRMPLRVLRPEQLVDSVLVALGTPPAENAKLRRQILAIPLAQERDWDDLQLHEKLIQTVALLNRKEIQSLLSDSNTRLISEAAKIAAAEATLNHVYRATLGRPATKDEYERITKALPKPNKGGTEPLQDVIWALLNSSEFILNH
jgi:hypothetical protein